MLAWLIKTKNCTYSYTLRSEKGTEKMPRRSTLKDREPLLLNPLHALVELLLCDHPFEKVSDQLLELHFKLCSSLIDGISLHQVPPPVNLLLPKSFPYDAMRFRSGQPLQGESFSYQR